MKKTSVSEVSGSYPTAAPSDGAMTGKTAMVEGGDTAQAIWTLTAGTATYQILGWRAVEAKWVPVSTSLAGDTTTTGGTFMQTASLIGDWTHVCLWRAAGAGSAASITLYTDLNS